MSNFVAVLDACVRYPVSLRDTLLRAAGAVLYKVQLTDEVLNPLLKDA